MTLLKRRVATAALALCGCFAGPALGESASFGPQVVIGDGPQTLSFTLPVSSTISADAMLTLTVMGDLNANTETLTATIQGGGQTLSLGVLFDGNSGNDLFDFANDTMPQCSNTSTALSEERVGVATIPKDQLEPLLANGAVTISFTSTGGVGDGVNDFCFSSPLFPAPGANVSFGLSGLLQFDSTVVEETTTAAQSLAANRASVALANLPTLSVRLSGGGGGGSASAFSGQGTETAGSFSFSTSLAALRQQGAESDPTAAAFHAGTGLGRVDFWLGGSYTYYQSDIAGSASEGDIGVLQAGVDYRAGEQLLVGLFAMGDLLDGDSAGGVGSSGLGFMAGPYAVYGLAENVHLEGLIAAGKAFNEIDVTGQSTAEYESERLLFSTRLSGDWRADNWTFTPSTRLSYYAERQEAFTDGSGAAVPESTTTLGQLRFGPEVAYDLQIDDGASIRPFAGVEGVWAFSQSDQVVSGSTVTPDDLSASVAVGFDASIGAASLRAAGRYDGVGTDQLESITGEVQLRVPLN